jgi:hypothetical protein
MTQLRKPLTLVDICGFHEYGQIGSFFFELRAPPDILQT